MYELDFESTRSHSVGGDIDEGTTMATTWFITGTSSGFGRLLTEHLLGRGDRVAATVRRPEALDDLRTEHGDRLWGARLDVTDTEQVYRVVDDAFEALDTIDVLDAVRTGDPDAAQAAMRAHIARTRSTMTDSVASVAGGGGS
jgi:NADP-dependent 3-hydroxy acid dehydrogenase YdfG